MTSEIIRIEDAKRPTPAPKCFVMMPSGGHGEYRQGGEDEANFVYSHIIEPAVTAVLGTGCADREVDNLAPGAVTPKIIRKLHEYDLAIVDITGGNPNVFLELGVRYSLKPKTTIILRQKNTDIPFDITNYRVLEYMPFRFDEARRRLEDIIRQAKDDKLRNDSPVADALGEYELLFKTKTSQERMPWEYYFRTIESIALILKTAHSEQGQKKYSPDAIIGISNGGMIFADHLHRAGIYKPKDCKFVSLWADRSVTGKYFHCKTNEHLIRGILEDFKKPPNDIRMLLVDDNVSGGDTSRQAIEFIKTHAGTDVHVRFLPLFFNREDILPRISDIILWGQRAFEFEKSEITNLHFVHYRYFPYDKPISGH